MNNTVSITKELENSLVFDFLNYKALLKKVFDSNYKYIILSTRRCLILTDLFLNGEVVAINSDICMLSDYALCTIFDTIGENDRICIIDDILIHGRKVEQICTILESLNIKKENIDVYVCLENDESKLSPSRNVLSETIVETPIWRDSSNRIVQCILSTETPYVSYINYLTLKNSDDINDYKKIGNFYQCTNDVLNEQGISLEIAYHKSEYNDEIRLLKQLTHIVCVRKYTYGSNKSIVIPFAVLRSIDNTRASEFFSGIANIFKENGLKNISELLSCSYSKIENRQNSLYIDMLNEYKYNMLTMILSWIYGIYLFSVDDVNYNLQNSIVKYSLFWKKEVLHELETVTQDIAKSILSEDMNFSEFLAYNIALDKDYEDLFEQDIEKINLLSDRNACKDTWDEFVFKSFQVDEKRAIEGKNRFSGVPVDILLKDINIDILPYFMQELIGSWDVGRSSYFANVDKKSTSIANYISPGEQAYRIMLMKYIEALQCIYYVIRNRPSEEKKREALSRFCDYLKGENSISDDFKTQIYKLKDIIIDDIDANRLPTLVRPMTNQKIFKQINEYIAKHKEGVL